MKDVLTILLAGGKGTRLDPLTRERAKPAVPFGGAYRIVDFALSNCLNSRQLRIVVLPQYKSLSLERHIAQGWSRFFHPEFGHWLDIASPQFRIDDDWYLVQKYGGHLVSQYKAINLDDQEFADAIETLISLGHL